MPNPEARVFRPQNEKMNQLIESLMKVRAAEKIIERPSWTQYCSYLINKDMAEVTQRYHNRLPGT